MAKSEFSVVGLAHKLLLAAEAQGHTAASLNLLAEDPKLLADICAVQEGTALIIPIETVSELPPFAPAVQNTITVLPNLILAERIALGKYDWKNGDITESRFPHNTATIGEWEYDLYHPNLSLSSEDAKSSAEVDGWVVAEAEHVLAFGATFPDVQRKFTVIALGSVCTVRGSRCVLVLWYVRGERYLDLGGWGGTWYSDYRFLRVRKVKPSVA